MIHREQYKKKNVEGFYSVSNARSYLSNPDEIDAYSHDIAMEIKYFYPNRKPHTIINRIDKFTKLYSYKKYKEAFKGTEWDRLRISLLRKCWKWISVAHLPKKC